MGDFGDRGLILLEADMPATGLLDGLWGDGMSTNLGYWEITARRGILKQRSHGNVIFVTCRDKTF